MSLFENGRVRRISRSAGRTLVYLICALGAVFLAARAPWGIIRAEEPDKPAGYQPYQTAFAAALKKLGGTPGPAGPRWIKPEAQPGREACTSCHLGTTDARMLDARLPYRKHPGHYLTDHPPDRFGCTVCHGGAGEGLTFAAAGHAPASDPQRLRQWTEHLGWRSPGTAGMVPTKSISGRCASCHGGLNKLDGAAPYRQARKLVASKRCNACHELPDAPVKKIKRAASLAGLGSKVSRDWLTAYLGNPHAFRQGTAMPAFGYQKGEIAALSGWLLASAVSDIGWQDGDPSSDAAAVARGRTAVERRRCQTCHEIPGINDTGFIKQTKIGASLARIGEKLNPQWIRRWLANPQKLQPGSGMPRFRFDRGEIDDITAFLVSLRSKGAAPAQRGAVAKADEARGRAVATRYGCASCHKIGGLAVPPRTDLKGIAEPLFARLAKRGRDARSLEGPKGIFHRKPRSPRLFGADETTAPLLPFLASAIKLPVSDKFRKSPAPIRRTLELKGAAGKLVRELRCLSCHSAKGEGGDIGPNLTHAGSKLQRDWLISFLQKPSSIRPMNRARMPRFGLSESEARTLADWIRSDLTAPVVERSKLDLESAFGFVGQAKFKSPFGCVTCHSIDKHGGKIGPDLTHVGKRLRPKWIYHWIRDPKHWVPGVQMPTFEMKKEELLSITRYLSERK